MDTLNTIHSSDDLKDAILRLENQRREQAVAIRSQVQRMRPVNIIKNTFGDMRQSLHDGTGPLPALRDNVISTSLGMTIGWLIKKLFIAGSRNPIRLLLGTVLQITLVNAMAKRPDAVRTLALNLFRVLVIKRRQMQERRRQQHQVDTIDVPLVEVQG